VLGAGGVYFATAQGSTTCGEVDRAVLPSWARTGFSAPEPKVPHVVGDDERIAAILLGDPLSSPRDRERANKVLWVARDPLTEPSDLRIRARQGDATVERVVSGGPGPSTIDLPRPGCWDLELRWAGQTDRLHLAYR
jgi:hypothetical protein